MQISSSKESVLACLLELELLKNQMEIAHEIYYEELVRHICQKAILDKSR